MRLLFIAIFSFLSGYTHAHQDQIITIENENFYLQYKIGWSEHEIGSLCEILAHLGNELSKKKSFSQKIYINFNHDYTQSESPYFALGVRDFNIRDFRGKRTIKGEGLVLFIKDIDLNIKEVLNALSYGIDNYNSIKNRQKEIIIDQHYTLNGRPQFDTLTSISLKKVTEYIESTYPSVENLIRKKTYRGLNGREYFGNIHYYYQNNKFHFYNTNGSPNTKPNPKTGRLDTINFHEEAFLVVDKIRETVWDGYNGYFVFVNDSVFHYIPSSKVNSIGPFKMDSVRPGRRPVLKAEYEGSPIKRITLFFREYSGEYQKALFIPEKKMLISNYQNDEAELISSLMENERTDEPCIERVPKINWLFLSLIGLALVLNVLIFWKMLRTDRRE